MTMVSYHHNIISVCSNLLDECVTMVQTWQQVGAGGGEPELGRDTHDDGGDGGSSGTVAVGLLQRFTEMQAQMKELNTWMGEREEHTELREEIAMLRRTFRLDLVNFCNEDSRGFAPLGGNRQDCAVVACAAVSLSDAELRLPGDVLDAALATVCAPVIIRNKDDVDALDNSGVQLSCRLRVVDDDTLSALGEKVSVNVHEREGDDTTILPQYPRAVIKCELPSDSTEAKWGPGRGFLERFHSLSEVDMQATSITSFADRGLSVCGNLTSVKLPRTLTRVGEEFLTNCFKLVEIDLSHTALQEVGQRYLENCTGLRSVELPNTLTRVGHGFLGGCCSIEELDLRNTSIQRVGSYFLCSCTNLTVLNLPSSLETAGEYFLDGSKKCKLKELDLSHTAFSAASRGFLHKRQGLRVLKLPRTIVHTDGLLRDVPSKIEEIYIGDTLVDSNGRAKLRGEKMYMTKVYRYIL